MKVTVCSLALLALLSSASAAHAQLLPGPEPDDGPALVEQALQELEAGRFGEAERLFQEAANRWPEHPLPRVGLCEAREERGDLEGALEACRKARDLAPDQVLTSLRLGQVLVRAEHPSEAVSAFADARKLDPSNPEAYLMPALLLRDLGRHDEAIDVLEQARSAGAERPEGAEALSFMLLAKGEVERARDVAASARDRFPERGGLRLALGLALRQEPERRAEAAELLSEVAEEGIGDTGRVELELGILLLELGRNQEAVTHLREAVKRMPELHGARYRLAEALRATGDVAGAERELKRLEELSLERDDGAWEAVQLTTALQEAEDLAIQRRYTEALERVDAVLKDQPDSAQAHVLRAKVLSSLGSDSDALASIGRARELAPDAVEVRYLEGLFLVRLGEPAEGEAALLKAVDLDPRLAQAHELLGVVAANSDRHEEAVKRFRKALAEGADTPALRERLAASLRELGRLDEAEQVLAGFER